MWHGIWPIRWATSTGCVTGRATTPIFPRDPDGKERDVRDPVADRRRGAFNLVSSQVMLVTDKQADIAILRTLGLSPGSVMAVFVVQGVLIGISGIVAGVIGGVLLTNNLNHVMHFIERLLGFELMPADVYYISGGVPTELRPDNLLAIAIAFVMCMLPRCIRRGGPRVPIRRGAAL